MKTYKLSETTPFVKVEYIDNSNGLIKTEVKQGLQLFGAHVGPLTDADLNDAIAEWIIKEKPEFAQYIVKIENKKSKNQ